MSDALAALRDGARRVNRAPAVLFGMWALTIAAMLQAGAVMGSAIVRDLGHAPGADAVLGDLALTLQPTLIEFGDLLGGLGMLGGALPHFTSIVAMAVAYTIAWLFLAGGIIDRYARDRATRSFGFFGASGVFFFRFLRLAILQVIVYGVLFGLLNPWLLGRVVPAPVQIVFSGIFAALVAAASTIFDYTMVRAVVEDRRSMLGAVGSAVGFIRRHLTSVIALYVLDALVFSGVQFAHSLFAPDTDRGALAWVALTIGLGFVAARLWAKLLFWASDTALFQMQLAHAGYVARPEPLWPESPAAEAI